MGHSEADLFDGLGAGAGVICVCPKVIQHVSEELKRQADIDKATRKAREEKQLARGVQDLVQHPLVETPGLDPARGRGRGKKV